MNAPQMSREPGREIAPSDDTVAEETGPDLALVQKRGVADIMSAAANLARSLERVRVAQAREAGLRPPAYTLLGVVAAFGSAGTTVSEAALRLGVRPQGLSSAVAELAEAGLLARDVDRTDARARRLCITDEGLARLEQAGRVGERLVSTVLKNVPHPAVARLVLTRLDAAFKSALDQT